MAAEPSSVSFETTVAATGNNTGIVVPDEVIEQLAAGRRPAVLVDVNGYEYRNTVGVMGGKHMISISAAIRKAAGLKGGDPIRVTLTVADSPPEVTIPADFAAALAADEQAGAFFGKLSNSPGRCWPPRGRWRGGPRARRQPGRPASVRGGTPRSAGSGGTTGGFRTDRVLAPRDLLARVHTGAGRRLPAPCGGGIATASQSGHTAPR